MRIPRSYLKVAEVGAILLLCVSAAYASFDYYLKIESIPGESVDSAHSGWIDIFSYSWGVSRGQTDNLPAIQNFMFTKKLDKASPSFFSACCKGDHIPTLTLGLNRTIAGAAGESKPEIMKWVFTDVFVSSIKHTGTTSGGDLPSEEVSFTFQKIEWDYTPLDPVTFQPQTTITGGWDVGQNQPLAKGSASPLMLKMK